MNENEIHFDHILMPRTVMRFVIPLSDEKRNECIEEAYRIGDEMNRTTNVKASMSSFRVHETTDTFHDILVRITEMVKQAPWTDTNLIGHTLIDSWTAIYKKGEHTIPHVHTASASFCYYIQADETSAPLVFDGTPLVIKPFTGLCVMFEGNMMHSVPKQEEGADRIILAGNYMFDLDSPRVQ